MSLESTYIKIVKCKNLDYWYNGKIGQFFQVTNPELKKSFLINGKISVSVDLNEVINYYVDKGDFIFINKPKFLSRYDILKMENYGNH